MHVARNEHLQFNFEVGFFYIGRRQAKCVFKDKDIGELEKGEIVYKTTMVHQKTDTHTHTHTESWRQYVSQNIF